MNNPDRIMFISFINKYGLKTVLQTIVAHLRDLASHSYDLKGIPPSDLVKVAESLDSPFQRVEYEYKGKKVVFIQQFDVIEEGKPGWIDDGGKWFCVGDTLEEAQTAFREAVDDNNP